MIFYNDTLKGPAPNVWVCFIIIDTMYLGRIGDGYQSSESHTVPTEIKPYRKKDQFNILHGKQNQEFD